MRTVTVRLFTIGSGMLLSALGSLAVAPAAQAVPLVDAAVKVGCERKGGTVYLGADNRWHCKLPVQQATPSS